MSARKKHKSGSARKPAAPSAPKLRPDKPVAVLAAVGLLITGYLTLQAGGDDGALFCGPESGCDVVQSSRYSTL
ncbi:MAG: vitamin K epoxide reductase family protein, partial [Candidatus Wenzhouxiangella sp. M2_3B_020]